MSRVTKYLLDRVNYLFLFFVTLTLIGAIRSSNFDINKLSNKFVLLISVVVFIICIVFSHANLKDKNTFFLNKIFMFFREHCSSITLIFFGLIILCQMVVISNITTSIGWDVGRVISSVKAPEQVSDYLSYYPNNQLYYLIMYFYNKIISFLLPNLNGNWIIFQLLNILFIDIAAIFLYKATKNIFDKRIAICTLYLYMFLFMLSPWIMVPYTDQISLFLTTIVLYLYSNLKTISGIIFLGTTVVLGMIMGLSFLIKPSSIIYIIAFAILLLLKWIEEFRFSYRNILLGILIIASFSLTIVSFNHFMENQNIIKIDQKKAMPWTHFVMMGLTGTGGYNSDDVERDKKIIEPTLRKESNLEVISERLNNYKISGYLKFLVQKHFNNTDRGDFGWGRDGTPQQPARESKNKIQSLLRESYYQQGNKTNNTRFIMQVIWIIIIVGLIYSFYFKQNSFIVLCMKLTIIGAFLYLLIFEGGRSRYLIQYLPFILIVSSIGWVNQFDILITKYKKLNHLVS